MKGTTVQAVGYYFGAICIAASMTPGDRLEVLAIASLAGAAVFCAWLSGREYERRRRPGP